MRINQPPLFSGAVKSGFIADAAVVSGSIASGQINISHLASGVVNSFFTSGFVQSGMIGNGVPLLPNASLEDTESKDSWYAITGGSTGDLRVIETAI